MDFSDKLRSLGFPGRLAQIGADVPDLRSVLCHGLLGGLEHIITVVGSFGGALPGGTRGAADWADNQ